MVPPAFTFKSHRDINPLPPMGLGYLAAIIEKMGIEIKILDSLMLGWGHEEEVNKDIVRVGLSDSEIQEKISEYNPNVIGINCQFSRQHKIYPHIFSLIKKTKANCITVAGGAHATACHEEVLRDPCCDFLLLGEAEASFKDLLCKLIQEKDISSVDGLGWKSNGNIFINNKEKWISDLDSIPFPAYHLMKLDRYFGLEASHGTRHKNRYSPVITSRGCPAKCTFCSTHKVWGNRYRLRSIDNVLEEMRLLKNRYGVEEIMFEDDNVTANPQRATELFSRMIEEEFDFIWDTPNGVGAWSLTENILDLIKQSGCIKLNFPVESGAQHVLDNIIRKPLKLSKIKKLTEYCKKIKLDYGMFLVIGMPGEKIEDIWQSFHFAAECGCYTPHISVATPYPGTELYDSCVKNGYIDSEFNFDDLFIRSFCITTDDWNGEDLKRALKNGRKYLLKAKYRKYPHMLFIDGLRGFFNDPIGFPAKLFKLFSISL